MRRGLFLFIFFLVFKSYAQNTNIIPTSGKVGIGTLSPLQNLEAIDTLGVIFAHTKNTNIIGAHRIFGRAYSGNRFTNLIYATGTTYNNIVLGGGTAHGEPATSISFNTYPTVGTLNSGTQRFSINSNGFVAIGPQSAERLFHIQSEQLLFTRFKSTGIGGNSRVYSEYLNSANNGWAIMNMADAGVSPEFRFSPIANGVYGASVLSLWNNRIGIGIANPAHTLDIAGESIRITSPNSSYLNMNSLGSGVYAGSYINLGAGVVKSTDAFNQTRIDMNRGLDSTGNFQLSRMANGVYKGIFYRYEDLAGHRFYAASDRTTGTTYEVVRVTPQYKVGIGSTSPKGRLDLGSATQNNAISWGGTGNNYANIWTKYSNGNLVLATGLFPPDNSTGFESSYTAPNLGKAAIELGAFKDGGDIIFYNNPPSEVPVGNAFVPTERMRIKSNGYVGVGTPSPSTLLHVANYIGNSVRFNNLYFSNPLEISTGYARNGIFNNAEYLKVNGEGKWIIRNIGANDAAGMLMDNNGVVRIINLKSISTEERELTHTEFLSNTSILVNNEGKVAIGNFYPSEKLHVGANGTTRVSVESFNQNDAVLRLKTNNKVWEIDVDGNSSQTTKGSTFLINESDNGSNPRFMIEPGGNVGIGTIDTKGYKLAVDGNIIAEKVKVKNSNAWPDFVFKKDYQLPSLSDIEKYVSKNSHLPEIPSASEIEKDGQDLGEMNRILLKKVEELTLYLIEEHKKNIIQEEEIRKLNKKIDTLNRPK
jgi:hypothetical protein